MRKLTAFLITLFLTGCITAPKGLEREGVSLLSLDKLVVEDYACQCKQARLGGKILSGHSITGTNEVGNFEFTADFPVG